MLFATLIATALALPSAPAGNCQQQGPVYACAHDIATPAAKIVFTYNNKGSVWDNYKVGTDLTAWTSINGKQETRGPFTPIYGRVITGAFIEFDKLDASANELNVEFAVYNTEGKWDSIYGQNYKFQFKKN
ncbi:hypothetical protein BC833DRAFT_590093 [Globomyces pollinis-pini]|nr:hypothetical protein BC833DRAFT_590093 [Globomyces pollinis-pini]